jgi:hypothetical protein
MSLAIAIVPSESTVRSVRVHGDAQQTSRRTRERGYPVRFSLWFDRITGAVEYWMTPAQAPDQC